MINLYDYQDLEYQQFVSKLLPGVNNIIGVRIPVLRKLAKNVELDLLTDNTFEEIMLQGFVIARIKNIDSLIKKIPNFLLKINNWSICDSFAASLKITNKYREQMFNYLITLIDKSIFERRFLLVMLLDYYIYDEYIYKVKEVIYKIKKDDYYVLMACAWLISVIYIKNKEIGFSLINEKDFDDELINKSISKICDSYRVSKEEKKNLKKLRRFR